MTHRPEPAGELTVSEAVAITREYIKSQSLSEYTLYDWGLQLGRFERFCAAIRVSTVGQIDLIVAERFVWSRTKAGRGPAPATASHRRGVIRLMLRALRADGYDAPDPTIDMSLTEQPIVSMRPLTDDEIRRCELASITPKPTRFAGVLALGEAGATTWEMGMVNTDDIDVSKKTVRLAGSYRASERVNKLTDFGVAALTARLEVVPPGRLCFTPRGSLMSTSANACATLDKVLRRAQLFHLPGVRVDSIRAWAARRAYDAGGAEEAARVLGVRSLDTAVRVAGVKW